KQIQADILGFARVSYPQMQVRVEPWAEDATKLALYFVEEKFASLYPAQRYHYLSHLIPQDYLEQHLADSIWFELAPGENPEDLHYPDEDLIAEITPDVMDCLAGTSFFEGLDDAFCPVEPEAARAACYGDYRGSRAVLEAEGFAEEDELFDIFHVLMAKGGYCDCEILYNVAKGSRLAGEYWRARAEGLKPYDPHSPNRLNN
ncbi:MAG TPA: DUF2695 domain-containing protein, partial [Blastocatellia bacterium]|nr:DUF2695 domain-containing protein [Blastocatellia bacterium]